MFSAIFNSAPQKPVKEPEEGDLYKVITSHGRTFEIYYGYYEESDKLSPYGKPIEIYPDFNKNPIYTDKGVPFITAMQKPCENFRGALNQENTCLQCHYYEKCEELLGICNCSKNRKSLKKREVQNE